jgi:hypothetical protein
MKKPNLEKKFLEELSKTANVSVSCERAGLSRQTVYRWMEEDIEFREKVTQATYLGVESINDLAETQVIKNIKSGNQRSAEYWLSNHKENYMRPRPKEFWQNIYKTDEVTHGGCFIIGFDKSALYKKSFTESEILNTNIEEQDPVLQDMIKRYKPSIIKYIKPNEKD